jgi:superfamily II DNA or RNA helicase
VRPFDAPADDFKLAAEAQRIRLAGLHDPMAALASSAVQPLPHQLQAVYGELLPRAPLRFLLADDPGAGKTIMAGLYVKEMMLRSVVQRCLIVAPGGLVEQWREELRSKFGLEFEVLGASGAGASEGVAFGAHARLIARMDQLSRNDELIRQVEQREWDLVVIDEAHRMGAHWFGGTLRKTMRYELGRRLGGATRHLLLMTATPHTGSEADFHVFLALLDPDRFEGRYRTGVHPSDTSGLIRRMVKEELRTFEGTPLFPERIAQTVPYALSPLELDLYEAVSNYVREGMDRADRLEGNRRTTVGFAMTVLQRRLASSPQAILMSLRRRAERLARSRADLQAGVGVAPEMPTAPDSWDDEECAADEWERLEEQLVDAATAATTVAELTTELAALSDLVGLAEDVRRSGTDRKWNELRSILEGQLLADGHGTRRKLIVFTEHRDTLDYLSERIRALLGRQDSVGLIHGGVSRRERRRITEEFTRNPACQVLVATDAAGEGLNLQAAHLMVNYDLPWNPNRLEQRFGRVHRIGQKEVCRLWNLVADGTREGDVFATLLRKVEEQRRAFGGKVFDVLGESFADRPLRALLLEAIRYGEQPEVRARMEQVIEERVAEGLPDLLAERALASEVLPVDQVEEMRRQMAEARARRLQPHYLERFFCAAFPRLGGRYSRRESGRYELVNVPSALREEGAGLASRYERVTFSLDRVELRGTPDAELLVPGQPLHDAVVAAATAAWGATLERGTVLTSGETDLPRLLVGVRLDVVDGTGARIAARHEHVWVDESGGIEPAGPAPYLDCAAMTDREVLVRAQALTWLEEAEARALTWQIRHAGPALVDEVGPPRREELERSRRAIASRMGLEINWLAGEAMVAAEKEAAGTDSRASSIELGRRAAELEQRLQSRLVQIDRQLVLSVPAPRVTSVALVVPSSWLRSDEDVATAPAHAKETKAVERRGVEAVLAAERGLGREPEEMPFNNVGFDVLSRDATGEIIFIEVKARLDGAVDFEVSHSQVTRGKNAQPNYRLAVVVVDPRGPEHDEVRYVDDPFRDMDLGLYGNSVRMHLSRVWANAGAPH